ncbi:unnamed protein product [Closterium sp. Naga37s-1]|nr:unnamed protein product [Closterium sp. Naga37s-1]
MHCPDGTDEPGTSACPNASFFCRSRGHNPLLLFSSRVNDGICDCCDGSDEYDGRVVCPNTCAQAGAARRQQLAADVAKHREGVRQRQRAVEEWREKKVRLQEERGRLEDEEKELQEKEKVLKERKDALEKIEEEEKERQRKIEEEEEARRKAEEEKLHPAPAEPAEPADPAATEPAAAEPGAAEPDSAEPAAAEPVSTEPASTEPASTEPPVQQGMVGEPLRADAPDSAAAAAAADADAAAAAAAAAAALDNLVAGHDAAAAPADGNESGEGTDDDESDEDLSGLSKEELGRRIASRWAHGEDGPGGAEVGGGEGGKADGEGEGEGGDGVDLGGDDGLGYDDGDDDKDYEDMEHDAHGASTEDAEDFAAHSEHEDDDVWRHESGASKEDAEDFAAHSDHEDDDVWQHESGTVHLLPPPSLWDKAKQCGRVSPPSSLFSHSNPAHCLSPIVLLLLSSAPAASWPPSLWDKAMQVWSYVSSLVSHCLSPTLLPLPPPSAPAASWPPSLWDKAMQVWAGRMCARSSFETSQKAKQVWAGRICPRLSPTRSLPHFSRPYHPSPFSSLPPPSSPFPHFLRPPPSSPFLPQSAPTPPPSLWDKAKQVWSRVSSLVSSKPSLPVNETDLLTIRSEYNVISTKLSKARGRLRTVKEKLEKDLGPDGEFASFADHCFSFKVDQYEYEVCPYRQVKQKEKHHSDTTVGRWSGFEDNYRTMMFKNGDKCWNGPNRSIKVKLECGLKTGIKSVEEPSRCEYEAVLVTTAVCNAELAQELERQLKEMEDDLAGHDEL